MPIRGAEKSVLWKVGALQLIGTEYNATHIRWYDVFEWLWLVFKIVL